MDFINLYKELIYRPDGFPSFKVDQDGFISIRPGERFCRVEENGALCPMRKGFAQTSNLRHHVKSYHQGVTCAVKKQSGLPSAKDAAITNELIQQMMLAAKRYAKKHNRPRLGDEPRVVIQNTEIRRGRYKTKEYISSDEESDSPAPKRKKAKSKRYYSSTEDERLLVRKKKQRKPIEISSDEEDEEEESEKSRRRQKKRQDSDFSAEKESRVSREKHKRRKDSDSSAEEEKLSVARKKQKRHQNNDSSVESRKKEKRRQDNDSSAEEEQLRVV
ncbi:hypothetical protein BDR22DRAFT_877952 [Usnea florida]